MKKKRVPPFLRRCNKFPHSAVVGNDRHNNDAHPATHSTLHHHDHPQEQEQEQQQQPQHHLYHRAWGRAFELSVSLKKLLKTEYATELLFEFLLDDYESDGDYESEDDDDYEEEVQEEDRFNGIYIDKVIWMSNDVFIIWVGELSGRSFNLQFDHGASKINSIGFGLCEEECDMLWICQQQTSLTAVAPQAPVLGSGLPSSPSSSSSSSPTRLVKLMDTLLRLLARHKKLDYKQLDFLKLNAYPQTGRDLGAANNELLLFPASLKALKDFVSKAKSVRSLCLQNAGLSMEQWHAVASNCNPNIAILIEFSYDGEEYPYATPDFEILNRHCPKTIQLFYDEWKLKTQRQVLLTAIASTMLLEELDATLYFSENNGFFLSFMNAISQNRCLQKLEVLLKVIPNDFDLALGGEWELFCDALASHPTLQKVKVLFDDCVHFSLSPEKDRILLQKICRNTILCTFTISGNFLCNHSSFYEAVNPVLEFNPFRKVVQAVKHERDLVHKQALFTAILLSNKVCQHPEHRFLLFKDNFDLLEQYSLEGKLLSDWNMTIHHLASLQEMMQARGMAIPKSQMEKDKSSQHGRTRKRCRSS